MTNTLQRAASDHAAPSQSGRLIGVGVGPGDPELLTLAALRVLAQSDRVVAPTLAADTVGRAESIVAQANPALEISRVVFDMSPDPDPVDARAASHRAAAKQLLGWLDAGEQVAFVTLGDPNIFSTFSSLAEAVRAMRPEVDISTVPGIMAFQALASASGTVLLDGTESLSLVTALDGPDRAVEALTHPDQAVVIYKGGHYLPEIAASLASAGRSEGAVAGELLGLPGERFGPLADHDDQAGYLSTVIVPPVARAKTMRATGAEPGGTIAGLAEAGGS